jgi:hypothetical protein
MLNTEVHFWRQKLDKNGMAREPRPHLEKSHRQHWKTRTIGIPKLNAYPNTFCECDRPNKSGGASASVLELEIGPNDDVLGQHWHCLCISIVLA